MDLDEVVSKAEQVLTYYVPTFFERLQPTPLGLIRQELEKSQNIVTSIGLELGNAPDGAKILGAFNLLYWDIEIDQSLEPAKPRFNFTFAHEFGHLVLHRHIDPAALDLGESLVDTTDELRIGRIESGTARESLEWQANTFAAELMMPRRTVRSTLAAVQRELGWSRRPGHLYRPLSGKADGDIARVTRLVAEKFNVSKSAMEIRFRELQILEEEGAMDVHFAGLGDILFDSDNQ